MAKRRHSNRRRRRGGSGFLYKLLSMLVICGCLVAAVTLFFRVDSIEVSGQQRYTAQQVREASGIELGSNLYLLDKNMTAESIIDALPYVERIRISRRLPSTLCIEVWECGEPLALMQDGSTWLISPKGMIVEQADRDAAKEYASLSGCKLLAPSVGTRIALATEHASRQESVLALLAALDDEGILDQMDGIRLDDEKVLRMDYAGRFTVELPYGADYVYKLRFLQEALAQEEIQDNMTGTFVMTRDDGRVNFIQNVR